MSHSCLFLLLPHRALTALTRILIVGVSAVTALAAEPQLIPQLGDVADGVYQPQAMMVGGVVLPIYPADSAELKRDRVGEAEEYRMAKDVPGRINQIVNIHNPSIEFHPALKGGNTGATIILLPGGGHKTLNVAGGGTDFVPFFFNYGINCVIVRYRLRADGYNAEVDAVKDVQQAIRLVRSHAKEWGLDPQKIGVMGFSAGGEPGAASALYFERFDAENNQPDDPLAGVSSRPDFVGLIYTGPTPFRDEPELEFPKNVPPVFIAGASYGNAQHTEWAMQYYLRMLRAGVPNIEAHLYGNGGHGGGLQDRRGIPFGTWQTRFIDWFRDLGFLGKSGVPTKAATDIEAYVAKSKPE